MNQKYLVFVYILLTTIAFLSSRVVIGQNKLTWKEIPKGTETLSEVVPEGKALFVFEAKDNFLFDSDNSNIEQPEKKDGLYKLLVDIEPPSGGITISHNGIRTYIPYGRYNSTSLPTLNNKEVKYFLLTLATTIDCYNVTSETERSGPIYAQALYDKEALIILNVVPKDLNLSICGSEITNIVPEEGLYKVYIKPVRQQIILKSDNYDDNVIEFEEDQLKTKDVRYYHIQPPQTSMNIEASDPNMKVGSYTIGSSPIGALIQIIGDKSFNEKKLKTPYTVENYKEGKTVITLTLDRYEAIMDTITISSIEGKKSNYTLVPNFAFINCHIDPPIPTSIIVMDGKELSMIENDNVYECPKGFHHLEIDAPGYYSEIRQVSLAAGITYDINVRLKPNTASLSNSDAEVPPSSGNGYAPNFGTGSKSTTGSGYSSYPGTGYSATPGAGYKSTGGTGYKSTGGTGYKSTGGTGYNSTGGTGYKSTGGTGYKPTGGTGYNSTGGTGYKPTGGTGYKPTGGTGYKPTGGTGYKSTGGTGYKPAEGAGYKPSSGASYQQAGNKGNINTGRAVYQPSPVSAKKK